MKKVMIIGSSAATYAVADSYRLGGARIYAYGQFVNPGLNEIAEEYKTGRLDDISAIINFAGLIRPDFVFIGPPNSIIAGAADALLKIGIRAVAPFQKSAQLENSKSFTRRFLAKHHIPGAVKFRIFDSRSGMIEFANELDGNFVVKADGLMSTMGVRVAGEHFSSIAEGLEFAEECIKAQGRVVIEEKLVGEEFSLMSFCDGSTTIDMPAVQDFKRALTGDRGHNTGGMGAYSDANHLLPFLNLSTYLEAGAITRQVVKALKSATGEPYRGILYGGFMITAQGLRVLEYNVRIGDPEGVNAFALLKTNLVDLSMALLAGELSGFKVEFENMASVCKYVVPAGYPDNGRAGDKIVIGSLPEQVKIYTAWVEKTAAGLQTVGDHGVVGRSLAVFAKAKTLAEAERLAEAGCRQITGSVYHREDIASANLIEEKINRVAAYKI